MTTDAPRIIVTETTCDACQRPTFHVYHKDLPELWMEGKSAQEAAEQLVDRLITDLDAVFEPARQAAVHSAIQDVRSFLSHGAAPVPTAPETPRPGTL